jgi:hypothetical protein
LYRPFNDPLHGHKTMDSAIEGKHGLMPEFRWHGGEIRGVNVGRIGEDEVKEALGLRIEITANYPHTSFKPM